MREWASCACPVFAFVQMYSKLYMLRLGSHHSVKNFWPVNSGRAWNAITTYICSVKQRSACPGDN